ncbi:MAG: hypothetical protein IPF50_02560 [Proteobacteria bacterium]|nr:hypothetical protein [Pseudomonadota bacterium]
MRDQPRLPLVREQCAANLLVAMAATPDLYHETTGLDAASFRALCVRSCELGLTPSDNFIRQRVCSGAPPDQWPPDDPAAGL